MTPKRRLLGYLQEWSKIGIYRLLKNSVGRFPPTNAKPIPITSPPDPSLAFVERDGT